MREFTVKEFIDIITSQGWTHDHHSSNHFVYSKTGFPNKLTVNFHNRTMNPCIAKRLLKEAKINL